MQTLVESHLLSSEETVQYSCLTLAITGWSFEKMNNWYFFINWMLEFVIRHISGTPYFNQAQCHKFSGLWPFRSRWFQEGENVSGDQFYYISLKIDYDYPVTLFPPIWSLIVKDLDISTVPWKKKSTYAMAIGSKCFVLFCFGPLSFLCLFWHL